MDIRAISKFVRISPYKLRPYADVIRGQSVTKAISWLKTVNVQRIVPLLKTLNSACANAKNLHPDVNVADELVVKEVRVDQGPIIRYFKPGAMGRANPQRKRLSHIEIILGKK